MLTVLMALKSYHPMFLERAIASVIAQDSPAWRLLVIVEELERPHFQELLTNALTDNRIELVTHNGHGIAAPLNAGMRYASTEFVGILHGDDLWSSESVRVLLRDIAAYPNVDFFHSSRRFIDEDDRSLSGVYEAKQRFSVEDFHWSSPVKHLLCWRRELALAIGGIDESLPSVGPDDYDFPWVMMDRGATFRAVRECLYIYRDHRQSYRLTTHLPLTVHRDGIRRILEKHHVPPAIIAKRLAESERSYLQQCLYESEADMAAKQASGHDPRTGWREPYR